MPLENTYSLSENTTHDSVATPLCVDFLASTPSIIIVPVDSSVKYRYNSVKTDLLRVTVWNIFGIFVKVNLVLKVYF